MRVLTGSLNKFTMIIAVLLWIGIYCFGVNAELHYCQTDECVKTGIEFDRAMNQHVSTPCNNFYQYACGSQNKKLREIFNTMKTQELYLRQKFDDYNEKTYDIDILSTLRPSDTPHVELIKRYIQLHNDRDKMNEVGVKPIVNFLNNVPYHKSWWELENWAFSIGLSSTLFTVEIEKDWNNYEKKGYIKLNKPYTRSLRKNYFVTSGNMLTKLKEAGLNPIIADRLSAGIAKEKEFYSFIKVPSRSRSRSRDRNSRNWRIGLSNWKELWNNGRKVSSNLTKNDWDNYFEKYWRGLVIDNGIVPLLKIGSFEIVRSDSLIPTTLGASVERFGDDNMKNILLWRIVTQLAEYAGEETQDLVDLFPTQNYLPDDKLHAMEKSYWYDIIPKSVRRSIQKMYGEVDLQAKLLMYKEIAKVPWDREPLTPREQKQLKNLAFRVQETKRIVKSVQTELTLEESVLRKKENFSPFECISVKTSKICQDAYVKFARYKKEIPLHKERIKVLKAHYNATRNEHSRSTTRYNNFLAKYGIRQSFYNNDERKITLHKYIKERRYPQFPFDDKLTRPKMIIETPQVNADYVEMGLSLKKWERAMLLQAPEKVELNEDDAKFTINGFTDDLFARFKKNRPTSLNYGALGSALGYEISHRLRETTIGGTPVINLEYYITRELLQKNNSDWRNLLESFIKSNLHGGTFNWVDMPALLSLFDEFLKKNPDGKMHRHFNVTEWLLIGYEVANTKMGLKSAWNARQRNMRLNGEKDDRLADIGGKRILSLLNQDMLFFHSFGYSNCETESSTIKKTALNMILKSYAKFNDVYRSTCMAVI